MIWWLSHQSASHLESHVAGGRDAVLLRIRAGARGAACDRIAPSDPSSGSGCSFLSSDCSACLPGHSFPSFSSLLILVQPHCFWQHRKSQLAADGTI